MAQKPVRPHLASPMQVAQRTLIQRPGTASGMAPIRPNPTIALPVNAVNAPTADPGIDRVTDIYTYITRVTTDSQILYNGDRQWALITLILESAGPVAVGTRTDLLPVLSGKGALLVTNVPYQITIAKTSRLYIVSTAVNRVSVKIEPPPWLEQVTLAMQKTANK